MTMSKMSHFAITLVLIATTANYIQNDLKNCDSLFSTKAYVQ